jgi:effector-binding domain-containing protein
VQDPEIVDLEPEPTAAVRVQQPMAALDLAAAFDRFIPELARRATEDGATLAGPPFGRYHRFGPDVVDVEIGWPLTAPLEAWPALADVPAGEAGRSELPGGTVARAVHLGPYDGLAASYDALHAWIHEQPGVDDAAGPWESYAESPMDAADPAAVRTVICWPLRRE